MAGTASMTQKRNQNTYPSVPTISHNTMWTSLLVASWCMVASADAAKVLVTGASGRTGRLVFNQLKEQGDSPVG